jgi:acetyltransferase-like isoleucine patch superfamily enzyme
MSVIKLFKYVKYLKDLSKYLFRKKESSFSLKHFNDFFYLKSLGVDTQIGFVTLIGKPIIQKHPNSIIRIEKGVTLVSNSGGNIAGINHPVILATLHENAIIHLGKDCGLSGASICSASSITIGEYAGIGANVSVYDTDFHSVNPYERKYDASKFLTKPIIIDDFAWIGGNSIVLKGVHIGKGGVVGAGSVVTKNIPELTIFAGNPAKFIKKIEIKNETYSYLFDTSKK